MNLFKNIILSILSVQEKILTARLRKTIGIKNLSKNKKVFNNGCLLSLTSLADSDKQRMEDELELILKSCNYEPSEVLNYIKKHNTEIYFVDSAKTLNSIGENEGFIYPQKGCKALYISLLVNRKIKFNTPEMFILSNGDINKYYFIYHFYNWYTFKHGIEGLNADSQALLNKYLFNANENDFSKLQLTDIYKLKVAIKQDKSAIEFVCKLCQKYEGAKQALEKLKSDGANL